MNETNAVSTQVTGAAGQVGLHPDPYGHNLIIILMGSYGLRWMNRLRVTFAGGLNAALILLDVLVHEDGWPVGETAIRPTVGGPRPDRPVAAIAADTGIPRETVRRHLAALASAGWLEGAGAARYRTSARGTGSAWFNFTRY